LFNRLFNLWEDIPHEQREPLLTPSLDAKARELVLMNPFALILAASLDRGTKAEIIWSTPYWLRE